MNKSTRTGVLVIALIIFIAAAAYYLFTTTTNDKNDTGVAEGHHLERVENEEVAFGFGYESGPQGLALFEPEVSGEPLKAAYILMPVEDYVLVHNNQAEESPATISMFVFTKPEQPEGSDLSRLEEVRQWADENQELTSIDQAQAEPEIVDIDGVKALKYTTAGTFNQEIYVASYNKNIYLLVGQYENESDKIKQDYERVISEIVFQ